MSTGYIVLPDTGGAGDSPITTIGNTASVSLNIVAEELTGNVNVAASGTAAASGYFAALTEIKTDGLFVSAPQSGVRSSPLTGYAVASGAVASTDTVLQGFNKLGYYVYQHSEALEVTVAKSGAMFTEISTALASIIDATVSKQYLIKVSPGVYAPFAAKAFVTISGISGTVQVVGTGATALTANLGANESAGIIGIDFYCYATADNQRAATLVGDVYFNLCGFYLLPQADVATSIVSASPVSLQVFGICTAFVFSTVASTKVIDGIVFGGGGACSTYSSSIQINVNSLSGNTTCLSETGTGERNINNMLVVYNNTNASFSGTVKGFGVATASNFIRISQGTQIRLSGAGAGTAYAFYLDSATDNAEYFHTNGVEFIDSFTAGQSFNSFTGLGDNHKIWLSSMNKDLPKDGVGLSVVTPYDADRSGFVAWGGSGAYWSYNTGTKKVTILRRGIGCVKDVPVVWAVGQESAALTDLATNFIYMDSKGIIGSTTTESSDNFVNNIVLLEIWVEGTNYLVTKENHPYKFPTSTSNYLHDSIGSILESASQTLAINSAANRTVNLVGDNTILDHGVSTTVSAQTPVTWNQIVANTSTGKAYLRSTASGIDSVISAANATGTNAGNNQRVVYRLGVIKDNLNSTAAQFVCLADNASSLTLAAANNRITSGLVLAFPTEFAYLEICQLGYAIVHADGSGAGTLSQVTTALQVFGAAFVAGGTSSSASLITTDPTNFDKNLAATDTNLQLVSTAFDEFNALPSDGTNASLSPDLRNKVAFATSASGTSATFTFGTRGAIEFIVDANTSGGMTIACDYKATGVNALSDPSNLFLATDAGTGIVVTKSANSAAVTLKNRLGVNTAIGVLAIRASGTATAWS